MGSVGAQWISSFFNELGALDGAILAAIATGIFAVLTRWRDAVNLRKRLRSVVVGELRALHAHYRAAAETFSGGMVPPHCESHLRMAKAEEPKAFDGAALVQAGVPRRLIPQLIQLKRYIRNNNIQCDVALSKYQEDPQSYLELEKLDRRFENVVRATGLLLHRLHERPVDVMLEFERET